MSTGKPATTREVLAVVDPGSASREEVLDVLRALNDYHVAAGGLGLNFDVRDGLIECVALTAEPEGQDKDERHG